MKTIKTLFLVLGVSANKDIGGIVRSLAPLAPARVFAVRNASERSAAADRVAEACRALGLDTETAPSVEAGLASARSVASEGDLILVTGSLYTVADARRAIIT